MFPEDLHHPPFLPWREPAVRAAGRARRRRVSLEHVGAEQLTKVVEKEFGESLRGVEGRQDYLSQLVEYRIDRPMAALKSFDSGHPDVICKRVERSARNMIVHPVDRTPIARARVGLKIINADATRRPVHDPRVAIIYPDLASLRARRRQMHRDHECSFRGDALRALRHTDVGYQPSDRDGRLGSRSNNEARGFREAEVRRHSGAVGRLPLSFMRHNLVSSCAFIDPSGQMEARSAPSRNTLDLLHQVPRRRADPSANAESSASARGESDDTDGAAEQGRLLRNLTDSVLPAGTQRRGRTAAQNSNEC